MKKQDNRKITDKRGCAAEIFRGARAGIARVSVSVLNEKFLAEYAKRRGIRFPRAYAWIVYLQEIYISSPSAVSGDVSFTERL